MTDLIIELDPYGTVIPDLRNVLYATCHGEIPEDLVRDFFEIDPFLRGLPAEQAVPQAADRLPELYANIPADEKLLVLLGSVLSAGGQVNVIVSTSFSRCKPCRSVLERYLSILPAGVSYSSQRPGREAILVSRQMKTVSAALHHSKQAIHYETAPRLLRELELRGYNLQMPEIVAHT